MGLLRRAAFSNATFMSQIEFATKYNLRHCALFSKINDRMIITDSAGLDADTIIKSVSHEDFWNGTIINGAKFTDESLPQFYQFFSDAIRPKISMIYFLRLSDETIFMSVQFHDEIMKLPQDDEIKRNLPTYYNKSHEKIKQAIIPEKIPASVASVFLVSVHEAAMLSIPKNLPETFSDIFFHAICNEVFYKVKQVCASPNMAFHTNDETMKLIIFSATSIDEELFSTHLCHSLKKVLGIYAKNVNVSLYGTASTAQEIKSLI